MFAHIFLLWRPENTHGWADSFAWVTNGSLTSLEWPADLYLQSKITDHILSFKSRVFSVYDWLSELTNFRFFPVICWSYPLTEISVILSTGNKIHFSLSCETTVLMLSCDRIEAAKFIHGNLSPAKLVYYKQQLFHRITEWKWESENIDKYMDLAWELKRLLCIKVKMIPLIDGVIGAVPKGLEKRRRQLEVRGRIKTIHTIELLRSDFWRAEETCCYLASSEKQPKLKLEWKTRIKWK